jgi:hypothetical protein
MHSHEYASFGSYAQIFDVQIAGHLQGKGGEEY